MMRRRSDLPPADPQPWSELIPPDSFYARLAKWRDVLVVDEDYAPLYKDSPKGRPSIPPWGSVSKTRASTRPCCVAFAASCWSEGWSGNCSSDW
jgi:hypothetical protein